MDADTHFIHATVEMVYWLLLQCYLGIEIWTKEVQAHFQIDLSKTIHFDVIGLLI